MADAVLRDLGRRDVVTGAGPRRLAGRRAWIAFFFALPLITIVACLVLYPALYSIHLATLNKSMTKFVGFGNFAFLFKRNTFWMVVEQSCLFAITAVIFKAIIGFVVAHFVHNLPQKGQRKWRGMLLVPWVIPPAMSTLAWLWLFDSSYSDQLAARASRHLGGAVARQRVLGAHRHHPRQCLGWRPVSS